MNSTERDWSANPANPTRIFAAELRVGEVIVHGYGQREQVLVVQPSLTGESIVIDTVSPSGERRSHRFRRGQLLSVERVWGDDPPPGLEERAWFDMHSGVQSAGPTKLRTERIYFADIGLYGVEARFRRYRAVAGTRARAVELLREFAAMDHVELVR